MKIKKHLFNKKILTLSLTIFLTCFSCISLIKSLNNSNSFAAEESTNPPTLEEAQKIVQEVAAAYYRRGTDIQYDGRKRSPFIPPEEITSNQATDFVCTGLTQAIYYEAFGMITPVYNYNFYDYAENRQGKDGYQAEIRYFGNSNLTTKYQERLNDLQIGDILAYTYGNSNSEGHALIVYDFITNNENERTDAILMESKGGGSLSNERRSSFSIKAPLHVFRDLAVKQTSTASNNNPELYPKSGDISIINPNSSAGTINKNIFSNVANNPPTTSLTIYRPLAYITSGKYRNWRDSKKEKLTDISQDKLKISKSRLKYSGIRISKDNNKHSGGVVEQGEALKYTLTIENMSNDTYSNLLVKENILTNLVDVIDNGGGQLENNTLTWNISSIPAKSYREITYEVKVKTGNGLNGQEIISTGTVDKIPSTTVKNAIGNNLSSNQALNILTAYENNSSSYKGLELIDRTYKDVFGDKYTLELKNINLGKHYQEQFTPNTLECNPYQNTNNNPLIVTTDTYKVELTLDNGKTIKGVELNSQNNLSKIILNHYYSGLEQYFYIDKNDHNIAKCTNSQLIEFQTLNPYTSQDIKTTDRSYRIYPNTLNVGDVLIYSNKYYTNDQLNHSDSIKETFGEDNILENGIFAYIWDGQNFIGHNEGHGIVSYEINGEPYSFDQDFIKGEFKTTITGEYQNELSLLFAKDYYTILRPSLAIVTDNETAEDEEDINVPNTGTLSKNSQDQKTYYLLPLIIPIIITTTVIIILKKFFLKKHIKFEK